MNVLSIKLITHTVNKSLTKKQKQKKQGYSGGCGDAVVTRSCKGGAANKAPKICHKEQAKVMIMNM